MITHLAVIDDITIYPLHISALIIGDVYFMKNNSFDIYLVLGR